MCVQKSGFDWEDGPWHLMHECANFLQACDELNEAKNHFKEVLKFLYCEKKFDKEELENSLIGLAEQLQVRFPEDKRLIKGLQ